MRRNHSAVKIDSFDSHFEDFVFDYVRMTSKRQFIGGRLVGWILDGRGPRTGMRTRLIFGAGSLEEGVGSVK